VSAAVDFFIALLVFDAIIESRHESMKNKNLRHINSKMSYSLDIRRETRPHNSLGFTGRLNYGRGEKDVDCTTGFD